MTMVHSEIKQEILKLISFLQNRDYSIRKLSKILNSNGIFKVQTWISLKEKVRSLPDNNEFLTKIHTALNEEYSKNLNFGKKAIVFFDISSIDENGLDEFSKKLEEVIRDNLSTEYSQFFPNLIPEDILEDQSTQLFCVLHEQQSENIDKYWVCGKKSFKHRKEFQLGDAPDEVQEYFSGFDVGLYDEVVAIRQDFKQLVSYFTIDKLNGLLTFYSDATAITSQSDMDYLSDTLFSYLIKIYPPLASTACKKNIGRAIRNLYDEDIGRVTSFSHYTDSGSVKHEKLDRKNSQEDLRFEQYHVGGMQSIEFRTEFHAIEKKWRSVSQTELFEPTVSLSYKSFLESTNHRVSACFMAEIDDCACQEDLDSLTEKILMFSNN